MEVIPRFKNHDSVLGGSESVPQASPRDLGVTEAAVSFFHNFVKEVAATASMARMKHTPESTTQKEVRRSNRFHKPAADNFPPPEAAAVPAPQIEPPAQVYTPPSPRCCL